MKCILIVFLTILSTSAAAQEIAQINLTYTEAVLITGPNNYRWEQTCANKRKFTFRSGKIFEEVPGYRCTRNGKTTEKRNPPGQGAVYVLNGTTDHTVRCSQSAGSKTLTCDDGLRVTVEFSGPTGSTTKRRLKSKLTNRELALEYQAVTSGFSTVGGVRNSYKDSRSSQKMIISIKGDECALKTLDQKPSYQRPKGGKIRVKTATKTCEIIRR